MIDYAARSGCAGCIFRDQPTKALQSFNNLRATAAIFMLETGASMDALRTDRGRKSREVVERDLTDLPLAR